MHTILAHRGAAWSAALAFAACTAAGASRSATCEWPQFHGPRRDNKSRETGLLARWPAEGPKLLWTAKGIGEGFSTVAITGGLIYTTGNVGRSTAISALDLAGKRQWQVANGPACRHEHPGTRSTPTIDAGRLYHENADGDLVCLDAKTGKAIWSRNILRDFHGRNINWGLAESLLVDGNNVICTPGGPGAGLAALDKATGRTVWVCRDTQDKPGYCSPTVIEHGGVRQIATFMARSVIGVEAATGKLLWRVEHHTPFDENITTPIYHDGRVFVSSRTSGSMLVRLPAAGAGPSAEVVWKTRAMDNQHGGVLLLDGYLYGASLRASPWGCLEFKTGKPVYGGRGIGRASMTFAEGMLYLLNHRRGVALVRPSPERFEAVSRFSIPAGGRGPSWAHPVVCGGRLYVRHSDHLHCYDVKRRDGAAGR